MGLLCSGKHIGRRFQPSLTREDKSVRNVAFSIVLSALGLLQIAVVFAALSHPPVQTATAGNGETEPPNALASAEAGRKSSKL
jgi:hypothetical protein